MPPKVQTERNEIVQIQRELKAPLLEFNKEDKNLFDAPQVYSPEQNASNQISQSNNLM